MPASVTLDDVVNGSFSWALWKVLDYLSTRFLPGSLLDDPQRAGKGAQGSNWPAARLNANNDGGRVADPPLQAVLTALRGIDPAELEAALASLSDDGSPLVRCLAWSLGTAGLSLPERQSRLDESLRQLNRAEATALVAILLWQAQR